MKFTHEMVLCIVNAGWSDAVMDAARSVGAQGGTVIKARGTANLEAETFFHITVQPEKEMVMILVPQSLKEPLMRALYNQVGLDTPGQGIAFSLPVDSVVGLSDIKQDKTETKSDKEEKKQEKEEQA